MESKRFRSPEEALWRLVQCISMDALRLSTALYSSIDLQIKMYAFYYFCQLFHTVDDDPTCWWHTNGQIDDAVEPYCCSCTVTNSRFSSKVVECDEASSDCPHDSPLEISTAGTRRVSCTISCVIILLLLVKCNPKSSHNIMLPENSVTIGLNRSSALVQPHLDSETTLLSRNVELWSFSFSDAMKSMGQKLYSHHLKFVNVTMPLRDLSFSVLTKVDVTTLQKKLSDIYHRLLSLSYKIKTNPIFISNGVKVSGVRKRNTKTFQISLLGGPNEGYCAMITVGKEQPQEASIYSYRGNREDIYTGYRSIANQLAYYIAYPA